MYSVTFSPQTYPKSKFQVARTIEQQFQGNVTSPSSVHFGRNDETSERTWRSHIMPKDRRRTAFSSAGSGHIDALRDLLVYHKDGRFDLNIVTDGEGNTLAHFAAGAGQVRWLKIAYDEAGLSLNAPNNHGYTALDTAKESLSYWKEQGNSEKIKQFEETIEFLGSHIDAGTANPAESKKKSRARIRPLLASAHQGLQEATRAVRRFLTKFIERLKEKLSS